MQVIQSCRNRKVGPRHPDGAKFCIPCNHYTLVSIENICQCCGIDLPDYKMGRHLKTKQTFDKLLKLNGHLISNSALFPTELELQPGWHIRIGVRTHWVPIVWLVRYAELPNLDSEDGRNKWDDFISSLIRETNLEFPNVTIAR
jgi:hypothetical protein